MLLKILQAVCVRTGRGSVSIRGGLVWMYPGVLVGSGLALPSWLLSATQAPCSAWPSP